MLNEVNEVKRLLDGKFNRKKGLYRDCFMLAKWYKEQKYEQYATRKLIQKWAEKYDVKLEIELNQVIQRAFDDKHKLVDKIEVKISRDDMREIFDRFDSDDVRYIAFLILCYAKVKSNKYNTFEIGFPGLANWSGISLSTIKQNHIKEIEEFGFIKKVDVENLKNEINENKKIKYKYFSKSNVYQLGFNTTKDSGEWVVNDIDIKNEYEKIKTSLYEII